MIKTFLPQSEHFNLETPSTVSNLFFFAAFISIK